MRFISETLSQSACFRSSVCRRPIAHTLKFTHPRRLHLHYSDCTIKLNAIIILRTAADRHTHGRGMWHVDVECECGTY